MYEAFVEYCKNTHIDMQGMHHEKADEYDILVFGVVSPTEHMIYEVAIVLYNDEDSADIFVRKRINDYFEDEMLYVVNELNKENRWVSFHFTKHSIVLKSSCKVEDMDQLFSEMVRNIEIACDCFPGICIGRRSESTWVN